MNKRKVLLKAVNERESDSLIKESLIRYLSNTCLLYTSFKKSIDFEESSVRLIELYKQEREKIYKTKIAYSYIINQLINKFIFMNRDVKLVLLNTCKEEREKLNKEVIDINAYSGIKKDEIKKQYICLWYTARCV